MEGRERRVYSGLFAGVDPLEGEARQPDNLAPRDDHGGDRSRQTMGASGFITSRMRGPLHTPSSSIRSGCSFGIAMQTSVPMQTCRSSVGMSGRPWGGRKESTVDEPRKIKVSRSSYPACRCYQFHLAGLQISLGSGCPHIRVTSSTSHSTDPDPDSTDIGMYPGA